MSRSASVDLARLFMDDLINRALDSIKLDSRGMDEILSDELRRNWVKVEMSPDFTHEIVEDLKYEDAEVIRGLDNHYYFMISDVNLRPIIVVQDRVDRLLGYPEAEFYIERSGRTKYKLDLDPDSYIVAPFSASYSGGKGHIVNVRDGFSFDDYEDEDEDSIKFTPEEVLEFISAY